MEKEEGVPGKEKGVKRAEKLRGREQTASKAERVSHADHGDIH